MSDMLFEDVPLEEARGTTESRIRSLSKEIIDRWRSGDANDALVIRCVDPQRMCARINYLIRRGYLNAKVRKAGEATILFPIEE